MSRFGGPNAGSVALPQQGPRTSLTSYDSTQERYIPYFQGTTGSRGKAKSAKSRGVNVSDVQPNKRPSVRRARPKVTDRKMPEANTNRARITNR